MPSGWCEWLPQQRPGDLQPAGTKVTPPRRFALSLPSFHQPAGELFILYDSEAQNYCTNTKKLHTQFTDIITCNEKINVPVWTAKTNKLVDVLRGSQNTVLCGLGWWNSCNDLTLPETGSNHDRMRNKWINWFLTHVAEDVTFKLQACLQPGACRNIYQSCWQKDNLIKSMLSLWNIEGFCFTGTELQQKITLFLNTTTVQHVQVSHETSLSTVNWSLPTPWQTLYD